MMVTFVSQCEKNALKKTRRVLDAFANRIGDNTWQTLITEDGLQTVKKMLRQTASRSTAVSCHWIRSRSRSQLLWVVGNKNKFNSEGVVPVNVTNSNVGCFQDKAQWKTINLIRYAAAIAGLFHDFGKANKLFQEKIDPEKDTVTFEPYRHEWISLRLFQAFVSSKNDDEWLDELSDVKPEAVASCFRDGLDGGINDDNNPLIIGKLAPFARLVAWIILAHHRLPMVPAWDKKLNLRADFKYINEWLRDNFDAVWNSYRCQDEDQKGRLKDNWTFLEKTLPYYSSHWRAKACMLASNAKQVLPVSSDGLYTDFINEQHFTSHLARLCMMLADHHYSAQEHITPEWQNPSYKVFANSDRKTKQLKQQLDEHLIGVSEHAERIVKKLPNLKRSLTSLDENELLSSPVSKEHRDMFGWQDKATKEAGNIAIDTLKQGFFGVNMASTGKGKTIANAKIMYALGRATGVVRFNVAMGLRTLTLQTGREFRDSIELTDEQLAVLVGGVAVTQLFENGQSAQKIEDFLEASGSASAQSVLQDELYVHYTGSTTDHSLSEWTKGNACLEKLLCAPVVVSTIDHLMPATEGVQGGKQIGPMLRLLTSDLVLDEPDDFGLEDLPALCRLVHWAGMLGSRVLLSTATMPPALAYALFQAYEAGWSQYAKANINGWNGEVCCAWFDEFSSSALKSGDFTTYRAQHEKFVSHRLKELAKNKKNKRLGQIVSIDNEKADIAFSIAAVCHQQLRLLHQNHHVSNGNLRVSIGLIRMANINPLVAVAKELLKIPAPDDTRIHYCVYHSRFPLAIRSFIENRLDIVLSRKNEDTFWARSEVSEVILRYPEAKNHIFVVLASPVAEVGRDHDYDWAIVEPSSMRSIIQLAGRVLRHREPEKTLSTPNILLLNQNFKALRGEAVCFNRPGFESNELQVKPHVLSKILQPEQYQIIDATPRIKMPMQVTETNININGRSVRQFSYLNDLEHMSLTQQLLSGEKNARVWWQCQSSWCGEVQRQQRFRKSDQDEAYYLYVDDQYTPPYWRWLNESIYPPKLGEVSDISIKPLHNAYFGAFRPLISGLYDR